MNRRFTALPLIGQQWAANNADRLLNRYWDYPRWLRGQRTDFDLFHVVDHSYSQLVHEVPPERTLVTCHDLDTFRCLLEPEQEPRPAWFRKMMQRTLDGLRRAARVVCDSTATYDQVLRYGLAPAERALVIPLGIHPAYSAEPDPVADAEARRLLGMVGGGPWLLHVGSTIQRKRIDVLLEVFASVRRKFPRARLIRVGGPFTAEQMELAQRLRVAKAITVLPFLTREVVAAVYRRAALVLLPSEREGFGLPVAEALACGVPVVASDLAVLREVGGEAATYCPVADTNAWDETIAALLDERQDDPIKWAQRRDEGLAQAAQFTWTEHARKLVALYQELLT
jgi:glycosyltransferase involved in cell wall biosynthesis